MVKILLKSSPLILNQNFNFPFKVKPIIRSFFFSPSDTTKKVAEFLSTEIDNEVKLYDTTVADSRSQKISLQKMCSYF